MNRNEIEVQLIELSQKAKKDKAAIGRRIQDCKKEIRELAEKARKKEDELTDLMNTAVKNTKDAFEQVIAQMRDEHIRKTMRLELEISQAKDGYDLTEEEYLNRKKELLAALSDIEKNEQVQSII